MGRKAEPGLEINRRLYGLVDLLSVCWFVIRTHAREVLVLAAVVAVPSNLITGVLAAGAGPADSFRISMLVDGLLGPISTMAIAWVTERALEGQRPTIREALQRAVSAWLPAVAVRMVSGMLIFALLLCLVVPGVIAWVRLAFTDQVVALRERRVGAVLDRSKVVVEGHWWHVLGHSSVLLLVTILPHFVFTFLTGIAEQRFGSFWFFDFTASTLGDLVGAYAQVGFAVLFLNLDHGRFGYEERAAA